MKQIIVLRKDLNMRKGKLVAQGAHASMAAILDEHHQVKDDPRISLWLNGKFTKICVSVDSEEELIEIHNEAKSQGILTTLIQDAGLTEFGGVPTLTAVSVGPDTAEKLNPITGHLKLL